ncbi:MAG TPA: SMC-Scp complex subunit ScpB [Gemmataceae bacterium]|nr:SMC-Scp complex subunit ScpB [Gemmataceae bacterium]
MLVRAAFPLRGPELRRRPCQLPRNHPLPALYRYQLRLPGQAAPQGELARDAKLALVEAALLAADEPLPGKKLAAVAGLADGNEARRLVQKLHDLYETDGTAFQVEEVAGGFQLFTRPEFHRWLVRFKHGGHDLRLTGMARETLAIIAYRQPIMRADIEAVRGVQCGDILRLLMEKGLIRIAGRHDSLGRPVLYGTTKKFLQVFGLRTLKDLPGVGETRQES